MVVAIQTVVERRAVFEQRRKARAIGEENVEIAVIVEIEYRDSAQRHLDQRLVFRGAVVERHHEVGFTFQEVEFS